MLRRISALWNREEEVARFLAKAYLVWLAAVLTYLLIEHGS
jgi:hypothetical protein